MIVLSRHAFSSSNFDQERWPPIPPEDAWTTAARITDNRFRAMRAWIESAGDTSGVKFDILKSNLISNLEQLTREARQNRYDEGHLAAQLNGLKEVVKGTSIDDGPLFADMYDFLGIDVPESVKGSIWGHQHWSTAYQVDASPSSARRRRWRH